MTPEAFAYWLQGFFELTDSKELSAAQLEVIRNHLKLVFTKVTPDVKLDEYIPRKPVDAWPPILPVHVTGAPYTWPYDITCHTGKLC
jgi:hypothetical protein